MEHIIVTNLDDDMVRLVPETGYRLVDTRNNKYYSEAVINKRFMKYFVAEALDA